MPFPSQVSLSACCVESPIFLYLLLTLIHPFSSPRNLVPGFSVPVSIVQYQQTVHWKRQKIAGSRVHLISVGIHFDIFWEKINTILNIFGGWTGRENGILQKKSINHQSCSFQRSNQHKGTKKCTRLQLFVERQIQSFFNYHVFHFILFYLILFCYYYFFAYLFIYLFIYLFYLKLTLEKNLPHPPRQGSLLLPPLSRVASSLGTREYFSIVSIMAALKNSPRSQCLHLQRRRTTRKGNGHSWSSRR